LASESVDSGCGEEETVPERGIDELKGDVFRILDDVSLFSAFAFVLV
jgi:hypothetical protein